MRNDPTEPEKRLWQALKGKQLAGFKFRRQQVHRPAGRRFLLSRCQTRDRGGWEHARCCI
ncbi:DUF559 domain-containing protein [Erythrobacter sp.]|uniref:DUF559 domain-containing protein n=1 Tax=Erythrobacter sp. TaxID=1042 RepID=UPI003FA5B344